MQSISTMVSISLFLHRDLNNQIINIKINVLFQAFYILFTADNHATDHESSMFTGLYDRRTHFTIVNTS